LALLFAWRPPIPMRALVAMAPTNVLLRGESVLGRQTPHEVRDELRRRAEDWLLDDAEIRRFIALLIRDLSDDQLIGNAKAALRQLETLGSLHEDLLVEGLASPDRQQRMLLAELLRGMQRAGSPPDELLRASVEDLRSDMRRGNLGDAWWFLMANRQAALPFLCAQIDSDDAQQREAITEILRASRVPPEVRERLLRAAVDDLGVLGDRSRRRSAFAFLVVGDAGGSEDAARTEHVAPDDEARTRAPVADELLAEAMRRGNRQARFLAAAVAGCLGRAALIEQAVPLLVRQLADNEIEGDAMVAARAIWGFGAAAIPALAPWRELDAEAGTPSWQGGQATARPADASGAGGEEPDVERQRAEQRRQAVEYIVARLTTRESRASLQRRYPLARLTLSRTDALDIPLDELRLPWTEFE
jgi:hypothetical protein